MEITNFVGAGIEYRFIPENNLDILLVGHFQSEKYFIDHRENILDLFEIDIETNQYLEKKYLHNKFRTSVYLLFLNVFLFIFDIQLKIILFLMIK